MKTIVILTREHMYVCVYVFNLIVMWILNMRSTLTNAVDCRCNAAQQVSRACLTLLRLYAHRLPTPHSLYPLPWSTTIPLIL